MAVRVRVRIKSIDNNILETMALVNTGFETEEAQILLPIKAAEKLGLWPDLPLDARIEIYDTAGGPVRIYLLPKKAKVSVIEEDKESHEVASDIVISHTEVEVLIGDKLAGKLKIVIEDPGEGIWRFRDDPYNQKRKSQKAEHWI